MSKKPSPPVPAGSGVNVPVGWRLVPDRHNEEWCRAMSRRTSYPQVHLAIQMVLETAPTLTDGHQPKAIETKSEKSKCRKPRKRSAE